MIFISDPANKHPIYNIVNCIVVGFYTLDIILRMISYGVVTHKESYFRNLSYIFEFIIISLAYVEIFLSKIISNLIDFSIGILISLILQAFNKLIRLLNIKFLNKMVSTTESFVNGFSSLGQISIILFLVFFVSSVIGNQLFSGIFLYRCLNMNFGYFMDFELSSMCKINKDCDFLTQKYLINFECHKSVINPFMNLMNFDNIYLSILCIFQLLTGQGITVLYTYLNKNFRDDYYISNIILHIFIFGISFILLVVVFFYIAIMKNIFTEVETIRHKKEPIKKNFIKQLLNKNANNEQTGYLEQPDKPKDEILKRDLTKIPKNMTSCREIIKYQKMNQNEINTLLSLIINRLHQLNQEKSSYKHSEIIASESRNEKIASSEESIMNSDNFNFLFEKGKELTKNMFNRINNKFQELAMMRLNRINEFENTDDSMTSKSETISSEFSERQSNSGNDGESFCEENKNFLVQDLKIRKNTTESLEKKFIDTSLDPHIEEDLEIENVYLSTHLSRQKIVPKMRSRSIQIKKYIFDTIEGNSHDPFLMKNYYFHKKNKYYNKYQDEQQNLINLVNTDFKINNKFDLCKKEENNDILE